MAFYARPTDILSPGDVFPELPIGTVSNPLKILRKSNYNPPAERGTQVRIRTQDGEFVVSKGRVGKAMLLSWGSQIEEDLRNFEGSGRAGGKCWLVAPIFPLHQIPE